MIETLEHQVAYVPLHHIVSQKEYRFRLPDEKYSLILKNSLQKIGQTHPLTLEEIEPGEYRLLDGHLRFDSILEIKNSGGSWDKVLADIIPALSHTPLQRFQLLLEKNFHGEKPYGLYERSCFFKKSFQDGISIQIMSEATSFSSHAIEDHIELSAVKRPLAERINSSLMDPTLALMLHHRYEAWLHTPYSSQALAVAQRLIDHATREKHNTRSWRFLLDFYWNKNRPFLSGRLKQS